MYLPLRLSSRLLAVVCASACAVAVQASVVFDSGAANGAALYFADASYAQSRAGTRASWSAPVTFNGFTWWGAYMSLANAHVAATGTDGFSLNIYATDGDAPGALVQSLDLGTGNRSLGANHFASGAPDYVYSAEFAGITLAPGDYFFSLLNTDTDDTSIWGWETSVGLGIPTGVASSRGDRAAWQASRDKSLAFQLTNRANLVPEPSTPVLVLAALAGLGFIGRKRTVAERG